MFEGAFQPEALKLASGLTISEVDVFRTGTPEVRALAVYPDDGFLIRVSVQLKDQAAIAARDHALEIQVRALEVTTGVSTSLSVNRFILPLR